MARTIAGNQTGKAAQGHDDVTDAQSEFYQRVTKASARCKEIFGDPLAFAHWMIKIPEGKLLEYMEEIIKQYDEAEQIHNWLDTGVEVRFNPALHGGIRLGNPHTDSKALYDFTPIPPDMPVIDMDTIKEVKF